jgi:hypothetical protein
MPIAKIQLPNGRIAKFEVEEGTTPDQVVEFANNQFNKSRIIDEQPQTQQINEAQQEQPVNQQNQPKMTRGEAFLTTATNIPLAPRLKAGISALTAKTMGGDESIGAFYDEALSNEFTKLKQARQQYPDQSFASQLASDVITGGKALKALGVAGNTVKQALAGGAILGGATAMGESQADLGSEQYLMDTGAGALYGAGGGVVGQQVGKLIGNIVPIARQTKEYFKKSTPEKTLTKILTPEEAGQQARKLTTSRIEQGRITTLPELGDENILGLTRILGKTQGSNKIITSYINNKSAGSAKRVGDLINNNLSAENYFNKLDDTIKTRKDIATPLYEKAYQEGNDALKEAMSLPTTGDVKVGRVRELINDDRIKSAIQTARKDYGINSDIPDISIKSLHGARQVVDDIIGSAKRAGENNKARSYIDLKNKINNVIYDVAPTMKEADNVFAGFSSLKNAQEEGLKFNQYRNGEEVKRAFKKLTAGEKETFKIGVKDYLMDKVAKSSDRNPAKAIFGNQLERKKIEAVFNNPKEFNDFAKRLNDEIRVFDVKQRIVGGSRTDFNLEEQSQLLDKIAKGAINLKTFGMGDVLLVAKDAIKKRYYGLNEQTAKGLAEIMIDPKKSVEILTKIAKTAKTAQEKTLIQKFTEDLSKKNFTGALANPLGRAMATETLQEQQNNNGVENGF